MNWMCIHLQVWWRMVCHMLCVTCHRLLGYSEGCTTGTATTNIFLLQVQLHSRSNYQGKCFVQVSAERHSPHGPQQLQQNPGREQATDSLSPLLHKHHQLMAQGVRLFKSNNFKTADMMRSKMQGAVKQWRWPSPPLGRSCETVAEEQRWSRSCTAAVPPARWLIPGRRHDQTHDPEVKRWDYIKSPLKSSLPHKEQPFILL